METDALRKTFRCLTDEDIAVLMDLATTKTFDAEELILTLDQPARGIMIVRDGFVTVEKTYPQGQIVLAKRGPGEVIGEMSFVESSGATADVRADGQVTMDIVEKDAIEAILTSDPGFSARYFRSLAIVLAARLKQATERVSELSMLEVVEMDQLHTPQTGQVTVRQLPDELVHEAHKFNDTMRNLERRAKEGAADMQEIDEAVATACDEVVALLEQFTNDETLLEIAYDDLLAFRDERQVGLGIGNTVFRETYPFLMASATIARCYMKPRGFSDDHVTIEAIYRNEPEGDGTLGPSIDRWFLSRPMCQSRRNVCKIVVKQIEKSLARRSAGANKQIACLAAGHATEIFDLLNSKTAERMSATCIDRDDEALLALAERASRRNCSEQLGLVHGDVMRLARGDEHCALPPQDAIYSFGMCEYLQDADIVELLDWVHGQLAGGAQVIITNLHASNPDRAFMEHMLDMKLHHRSEQELKAIFAQSSFNKKTPKITRDETNANMVAVCTKAK